MLLFFICENFDICEIQNLWKFIKIEVSIGFAFMFPTCSQHSKVPALILQVTLLPQGVMSSEQCAEVRFSVTETFWSRGEQFKSSVSNLPFWNWQVRESDLEPRSWLFLALPRILGLPPLTGPSIPLILPLNLPVLHLIPTMRKYPSSLLFCTLRMRRRSLPDWGYGTEVRGLSMNITSPHSASLSLSPFLDFQVPFWCTLRVIQSTLPLQPLVPRSSFFKAAGRHPSFPSTGNLGSKIHWFWRVAYPSATNCVKPGVSIYDIPKICDKHMVLVKLETRMRGKEAQEDGIWWGCVCVMCHMSFLFI